MSTAITIGDIPEAAARLLLPNLQLVLPTWMERHNDASFPWEPPAKGEVEIGFSYPLEEGRCVCGCLRKQHGTSTLKSGKVLRLECNACGDCPKYQELQLCGKMDLLPKSILNSRVHVPVDHKTTYRIDGTWARGWHLASQMSGYVWAARLYCGEPVNTCYINAIQLTEVPTSTRTCNEHGLPYAECGPEHLKTEIIGPIDRSDRQIKKWLQDTQGLAARYRKMLLKYTPERHFSLPMEGTFHDACGRCEFQEWCEAERPASLERLGYVKKPWSPIAFHMPGTKPKGSVFYIDNSTLRSIASCSTQAVARYGWDYTQAQTQNAYLRAGTAIHAGLEAYFKGLSAPKAMRAMERAYNEGKDGEE